MLDHKLLYRKIMKYDLFLMAIILLFSANVFADINLNINSQKTPLVWNVPHQNKNFIGRVEELKHIKDYFEPSGLKVLPLIGRGGIGKTQMVKQYAHLYKSIYDIIWWFDAKKDLTEQMKVLATEINLRLPTSEKINLLTKDDGSILLWVKNYLRTVQINWLLIFDDVLDYQSIISYIPDQHTSNKGNILITSKNIATWNEAKKISEFSRRESIDLLNKFLSENKVDVKDKLARLLGDYPLALIQAAVYINSIPNFEINDYIILYTKERGQLWAQEKQLLKKQNAMGLADNYTTTVSTALGITIQEVKQINKLAFELLCLSSMLDNDNIPLTVLNQYIEDVFLLNEAISILVQHNLLDFKNKASDGEAIYKMHEIVQLTVKDELSIKDKQKYIQTIAQNLNQTVPTQIDKSFPLLSKCQYLLSNIENILKEAEILEFVDNNLMTLQIRYLEFFLSGKRNYKHGKQIIEKITKSLNYPSSFKPSRLNTIRLYIMQSAYITWNDGQYIEGIEIIKKAQDLLQPLNMAEEHVMVYNRFAQNYYFIGELDIALDYSNASKKYIDGYKEFLGNKDAFYYARSIILNDRGELEKSLATINEALKVVYDIAQDDNLIGFFALHVLKSEILLKLGQYKDAYDSSLKLHQQAEIFFNQEPHQFTAVMLSMLAAATNQIGDVASAEKKINDSISTLSQIYQNESSRHNAFAHMVLGDIYRKQDKYKEAHQEYIYSEQIYNKVLKNNKIDDVSGLYARIAINGVDIKDPVITTYYLNLHKKIFGVAHHRNFEITTCLVKSNLYTQK